MTIVNVTTPVNIPMFSHRSFTTTEGRPIGNGVVFTYTVFNNNVVNTVNKDITSRDWRKLIASGANATTFLSGEEVVKHPGPGFAHVKVKKIAKDAYGYYPTYSQAVWLDVVRMDVPTLHLGATAAYEEANSQALTTFVERANRQMRAFEGSQYLAEARDSIRMIHGNSIEVHKHTDRYLTDVKRRVLGIQTRLPKRFRHRVERAGELANAVQSIVTQRYLEYVYGVAPLVKDVKSAAEALSQIHNYEDRDDHRMVSATAHATGLAQSKVSGLNWPPYFKLTCLENTQTVVSVTYRGVVDKRLESLGTVGQFVGLDLGAFLPTVWEIIPWSMVADYFTNVSEILDAASFARSRLRWCSKTVVYETKRSLSDFSLDTASILISQPTVKVVDSSLMPPSTVLTKRTVNRDTYNGTLIPDFRWNLPSPGQGLKMGALAANLRSVRKVIQQVLTK